MPRLLRVAEKTKDRSKQATIAQTISQSADELASQSLASLWRRLYHSYVHFSQPACDPFVTEEAPCPVIGKRRVAEPATSLDAMWAVGFASSCSSISSEALIVHLFLANEDFDVVSWVIAFCLIDRLQLRHYVRQRLQRLSFWKPRSDGNDVFRLEKDRLTQLLFTAYTLAFKWHLDYTVSVKYLTNLLPHTRVTRCCILRATIQEEPAMLAALDFNCSVPATHIEQLMDHFLTASERGYVLRVLRRT